MDADLRRLAAELRRVPSAEAAKWLVTNHPVGSESAGKGYVLLEHLSFKKKDALSLARHYLSNIPHATGRAYRVFARMLPLSVFLGVVREFMPAEPQNRRLLSYYLIPVLQEMDCPPKNAQILAVFLMELQGKP